MDEVFKWSPAFMTDLPEVDAQHRRLVALINRLGVLHTGDEEVSQRQIDAARAELLDCSTSSGRPMACSCWRSPSRRHFGLSLRCLRRDDPFDVSALSRSRSLSRAHLTASASSSRSYSNRSSNR